MAINLNAIAPLADGKHSPLLHKWLRRRAPTHGDVFQRKVGTLDCEPTAAGVWRPIDIWIGRADDDGWIHGNSLIEIIHGRARHYWALPIGAEGYRVITDKFWSEYTRDGRCAWDRDHRMRMIGDEHRWRYHSGGSGRCCQWCGTEQMVRRERSIEVVEKARDVWVPYSASVPAVIAWPRGSMGEEVCHG